MLPSAPAEHLKALKSIKRLDLPGTQVTAAGVAELHKALPQCQIVCDHGTLEPTAAAP